MKTAKRGGELATAKAFIEKISKENIDLREQLKKEKEWHAGSRRHVVMLCGALELLLEGSRRWGRGAAEVLQVQVMTLAHDFGTAQANAERDDREARQ